MSAGVLGAIAGVGPGVTEGLNAKELRAASKSERTINEAEESRTAERHQWDKDFANSLYSRDWVDQPGATLEQLEQYFLTPQGGQQVGPMSPVPPPQAQALPEQQPQQQGVPTSLPGFQEGGLAQVPAQAPGALPQGPQQGQPPPPQGGGQQQQMSRRDRYNTWYGRAARNAALTGGLEGYQKFQEMENATSRRQVLGYALQAVRAMDEGNVGEAMRAGNAALEVTPFDTGLKFQAQNGKLYMVGQDGELGKPLDANHLRAFTEDHMKTPEDYLAWKEQYEKERAALVGEGIDQQRADAASSQAGSYRMSVETAAGKAPSEILLNKANAYRALALGQAALTPDSDEDGGVSDSRINNIEQMEEEAQKGGLGFGTAWMSDMVKDTEVMNAAIGGAKLIRLMNDQAGMTNNHATEIARMAYFNDIPKDEDGNYASGAYPPNLQDAEVMTNDVGGFKVALHGMEILVPPIVGLRILQNQALPPPVTEE